MPNTAAVYARIDPQLKKDVEAILSELNITPSSLIQMLYGQIKLTKGIPFEIRLPVEKPRYIEDMTKEELEEMIKRSRKDIEEGRFYTSEEVDAMLREKYGIKWRIIRLFTLKKHSVIWMAYTAIYWQKV